MGSIPVKGLIYILALTFALSCGPDKNAGTATNIYERAIDRAAMALHDSQKGDTLRKLLVKSKAGWQEQPGYVEVRSEIERLKKSQRQVRLEIGNTNAGTYRVAWIVEHESGVTGFANVFTGGRLAQYAITRESWNEALQWIESHDQPWMCQSDLSVDGGSSYFLRTQTGTGVERLRHTALYPFPSIRIHRVSTA